MNKKAAIIAGVAIVGLLGAFTLGGKDKAQETEVKGTEIVAVQDENGTIEVTKNPERVVTFDYGILDILDNMGVDVVGLPKGSLPEYLSKYKEGQRIYHKRFGEGNISKIEPEGDDLKLDIQFDKVGHKRLMAKFANLEIIN